MPEDQLLIQPRRLLDSIILTGAYGHVWKRHHDAIASFGVQCCNPTSCIQARRRVTPTSTICVVVSLCSWLPIRRGHSSAECKGRPNVSRQTMSCQGRRETREVRDVKIYFVKLDRQQKTQGRTMNGACRPLRTPSHSTLPGVDTVPCEWAKSDAEKPVWCAERSLTFDMHNLSIGSARTSPARASYSCAGSDDSPADILHEMRVGSLELESCGLRTGWQLVTGRPIVSSTLPEGYRCFVDADVA